MTLSRIARGLVTNPGIETVRKIEAAMEQIEKENQATEAEAAK